MHVAPRYVVLLRIEVLQLLHNSIIDPHNSVYLQIVVATEDGNKKGHVHVQSAWTMPAANYPELGKDMAALMRLLCDVERGGQHPWNVVVKAYAENVALQPTLSKVTFPGLAGYCVKQRNESANFTCGSLSKALHECHQVPGDGHLTVLSRIRDKTPMDCYLCRCLRENVSDAEYDECNSSYDVFRQSVTGQRTPLNFYTIMNIATNYARGVIPKYEVAVETAIIWLLQTRRYYFDARMAMYGGVYSPVAVHMCALLPSLFRVSQA